MFCPENVNRKVTPLPLPSLPLILEWPLRVARAHPPIHIPYMKYESEHKDLMGQDYYVLSFPGRGQAMCTLCSHQYLSACLDRDSQVKEVELQTGRQQDMNGKALTKAVASTEQSTHLHPLGRTQGFPEQQQDEEESTKVLLHTQMQKPGTVPICGLLPSVYEHTQVPAIF